MEYHTSWKVLQCDRWAGGFRCATFIPCGGVKLEAFSGADHETPRFFTHCLSLSLRRAQLAVNHLVSAARTLMVTKLQGNGIGKGTMTGNVVIVGFSLSSEQKVGSFDGFSGLSTVGWRRPVGEL